MVLPAGLDRPVTSAHHRARALRRLAPLTLAVLDAVMMFVAFDLAYRARYQFGIGGKVHDFVSFTAYQPLVLLLVAVMVLALLTKGAYQFRLAHGTIDEIGAIASAATIAVAAIVIITAMLHRYGYSRAVIVYLWILLIPTVALGRGVFRWTESILYRRGYGTRRLLVVGLTESSKMIMQTLISRSELGYDLVGFVDHRGGFLRDFGRFRALGTLDDLPDLIEHGALDDLIVALPAAEHEAIWSILRSCEDRGVAVSLVPDLFEVSLGKVRVDAVGGIPLLGVAEKPLRSVARGVKRTLDVLIAGTLLLLLSPIMAGLALLVRLTSSGPSFLAQQRVGVGGRTFGLLKLRTMRTDAEDLQPGLRDLSEIDGPIFKMRDDPRTTAIGRHMRRWSLDELPQLLNVLAGDMSLVGPRPPLPSEVACYQPEHHRRLEVKPGLTGVWQVSGRSDLAFDEMVVMDVYYIDNWSIALDAKILLQTVTAVLGRHGAY
ncbi:MAG: sugar transferase [Chloroflexota bacterium]